MKVDPNQPAMPIIAGQTVYNTGIDTRTYIATKIMAGWAANPEADYDYEEMARMAVQAADDLIIELNKEGEK